MLAGGLKLTTGARLRDLWSFCVQKAAWTCVTQALPFGGCTQATSSADATFLHSANWEDDRPMLFVLHPAVSPLDALASHDVRSSEGQHQFPAADQHVSDDVECALMTAEPRAQPGSAPARRNRCETQLAASVRSTHRINGARPQSAGPRPVLAESQLGQAAVRGLHCSHRPLSAASCSPQQRRRLGPAHFRTDTVRPRTAVPGTLGPRGLQVASTIVVCAGRGGCSGLGRLRPSAAGKRACSYAQRHGRSAAHPSRGADLPAAVRS